MMPRLLQLLIYLLYVNTSVLASIVYVDVTAPSGGDGSSWALAINELSSAFFQANSGDKIWIKEGIYEVEEGLYIIKELEIYGGFDGTETTIDNRDLLNNHTVIRFDCPGETGMNFYPYEDVDFVIDGIRFEGLAKRCIYFLGDGGTWTFRNNYVSGGYTEEVISLYSEGSSLIYNNVFTNNLVVSSRGFADENILQLGASSSKVINNTFYNNVTDGLIFAANSPELTIYNNIFINPNSAFLKINTSYKIEDENFYYGNNYLENDTIQLGYDSLIRIDTNKMKSGQENIIGGIDVNIDFVDVSSNDFRLTDCNILSERGNSSEVLSSLDAANATRIIGSSVDIGAYEGIAPIVVYVDLDAIGANDGTSWTDAYTDLYTASLNTPCNSEIWVAQGNYLIQKNQPIQLRPNVKLLGGFSGSEGQANQRDWNLFTTRLNGNVGLMISKLDNSDTFIKAIEGRDGSSITIDGFEILNSYSQNTSASIIGGLNVGISTKVNLFNCHIHNNENALYKSAGDGHLANLLIEGNEADDLFLSHFMDGSDFIVDYCTITDNQFTTFFSIPDLGEVTISNSIFEDNTISPGHLISANGTQALSISSINIDTIDIVFDGAYQDSVVYQFDDIFTDQVGGDYTLKVCSPLIDLGEEPDFDFTYDLNRSQRISNDKPDIGCFEYAYPLTSVVYVDIDATGSNDGTSWNNAFNNLKDALNVAVQGSEVWVAEGTYHPFDDYVNSDPTDRFVPGCGVSIYGGFLGNETNISERDIDNHETVLSGRNFTNNKVAYHIMRLKDFTAESVIDGITFEGGFASSNAGVPAGGALWITEGLGTINNCTFKDNNGVDGGAIFVDNSPRIRILNSTFMSNAADNRGGAVFSNQSTLTLRNNIFRQNLALAIEGGGALFYKGSIGRLRNCLFEDNVATRGGGIMVGINNDIEVEFSTFYNNECNNTNEGGAVYLKFPSPAIFNSCIFYENEDNSSINNIDGSTSNVMVDNCIYEGGWSGAGLANIDDDPLFTDAINDDFTPRSCSPAVDQGDERLGVQVDLRLRSRSFGDGPDIGAYEQKNIFESEGIAGEDKQVCNNTSFTINYPIPQTDSVSTEWNGSEMVSGVMFDIVPQQPIRLDKINYHKECAPFTVNKVFYKEGSYQGSEITASDWTEIGSSFTLPVESCTLGDTSHINITGGLVLEQGKRYGLYVASTDQASATNLIYSSNDPTKGFGDTLSVDSMLVMFHGRGTRDFRFSTLTAFSRIFEGELVFSRYDSIEWFKNGSVVGVGSSYTNSTGEPVGIHTYEVIQYNVDGCSHSDSINVIAYEDNLYDECIDAYVLNVEDLDTLSGNHLTLLNNVCATPSGVSSTCNINIGRDIWLTFPGTVSSKLYIRLLPKTKLTDLFNLQMTIYEGSCGNLTEIACIDETGDMEAEEITLEGLSTNKQYYISVDAKAMQMGIFEVFLYDPCESFSESYSPFPDTIGYCSSVTGIDLEPDIISKDTLINDLSISTQRVSVYFDVVASNSILLEKIALEFGSSSGGGVSTFWLYTRHGSALSATTSPADWIFRGGFAMDEPSKVIREVPIVLDELLSVGDTLGFYIIEVSNGGTSLYTNLGSPTSIGSLGPADQNLSLYRGAEGYSTLFTGTLANKSVGIVGAFSYRLINQVQWRRNNSVFSNQLNISPTPVNGDMYTLFLEYYNGCRLRDTILLEGEGTIVTTSNDYEKGSLRSVIGCAGPNDVITFDTMQIGGNSITIKEPIIFENSFAIDIKGPSNSELITILISTLEGAFKNPISTKAVTVENALIKANLSTSSIIDNDGLFKLKNSMVRVNNSSINILRNKNQFFLEDSVFKSTFTDFPGQVFNTGQINVMGTSKIRL